MEQASSHSRVLKFGAFEVDLDGRELRKSGMRQKLAGQPFQMLQLLLEHPQKIVTHEELRQRLWREGTLVDYDLALRKAINRLREALGDSAESPRYIETIPRHGYRFIGSLEGTKGHSLAEMALPTAVLPATSRLRYRALTFFALGLLLLAGGSVFGLDIGGLRSRLLLKLHPPAIHSLAVLPLQNLSDDPAQEYFSDGMTDALITDLAQVDSVKVISRTSSMQYKQTKKSLPEIARELNVDGIIEGTVQRSGDRARITAQLIHGPSDKHIWAASYERDLQDVLALQQDVADEITRQIQARVTRPNPTSPAHLRTVDPRVLEAYIEGNYHLNGRGRGAGDDENKKAQGYFQQAIDADPTFAPAYIGLAYAHDHFLHGSTEDLEVMRKAAEKAVELDRSSSDAWVALGQEKFETWDWTGAEEDFRRALALNPNNARAHHNLANVLDTTGRLDEGWKEFQMAQELDPNQDHLALALYGRGEFDRAIAIHEKIALRDPGEGTNHFFLALNYARKGMYKAFVKEMATSNTLFGMPEVADSLQCAYDESGYQGALRQWAKDLEHLAATKQLYFPGVLAQVYTALGDKDRAFYWLEHSINITI